MSISIVNSTNFAVSQVSNTVSIPATSVNNTLIVVLVFDTPVGSTNFITSVTDDQNLAVYSRPASANFTASSKSFESDIYYRDLIPAGLTTITLNLLNSDTINMRGIVYEISGINHVSSLEDWDIKQVTANSTADSGNTKSTSSTNALFLYSAIRSISQTLTLVSAGSTTDYSTSSTNSGSIFGHKIGTGGAKTDITHGLSNATALLLIAIWNPNPNVYTRTLTDSVTNSDGLINNEDIVTSASDTFSLSDFIDLILAANARFKTLTDSTTSTDVISISSIFIRLLQETIILSDVCTIAFTGNRLLMDNIRTQDWIELKRFGSHWSN